MADFTPLLLLFLLLLSPASAAEFVYNHFPSSGAGADDLLIYGEASVSGGRLALTNDSAFTVGRVLHKTKVPAKSSSAGGAVLPFSTSFIFAISPLRGYRPGHGLAFLFAPVAGTGGATSAQHLGLFNFSTNGRADNHVLAVEFDLFPNPEFGDINGNHVGLDINSLTSLASHPAGYYPTSSPPSADVVDLVLNNGENYQAWIDYQDSTINITMAPAGMVKPERPLISETVNLSAVFEDEMYVGFCAATGQLVQSHRILSWSFSNTNFSAYEALVTTNLPSFVLRDSKSRSRTFAAAISAISAISALAALLLVGGYLVYARRRRRAREDIEDWELDYWPHRIEYRDIHRATGGFSDRNLIGAGGNGKVYKGVLHRTEEVAVKCIACGSDGAGIRQFLAEVSTLGRLEHRNLVPLRGWSKKTAAATSAAAAPVTTLILVYDFMPNGSLDKRIFSTGDCQTLTWEARVRVLKDVASALVYMHEGWGQSKVLHRDIKASNVMLDGEMRGRLGDFGLARLQSAAAGTTRVMGTVGYMAPELLHSGKATTETDVYGFGMLVLETITGRPPSPSPSPVCEAALVDWVWALWEKGESDRVLDPRLARRGGYDPDEVERVVGLALACTYLDPRARPSMREAVKLLDGPVDNLRGPVWVGKEAHLLDGESKKINARWYLGTRAKAQPTFEELRDSLSSPVSLSVSDLIEDGR